MWGANRIHTVSKTHYWRPSLILFNNAYRPYFRVWLFFASAYVSCVLVHKKHQLTVLWNTVKCKFQSFISKTIPRRMRLIVCFIIKCAKRSDWLCQHSGSGSRMCETVTRLFFGAPTVWHARLFWSVYFAVNFKCLASYGSGKHICTKYGKKLPSLPLNVQILWACLCITIYLRSLLRDKMNFAVCM